MVDPLAAIFYMIFSDLLSLNYNSALEGLSSLSLEERLQSTRAQYFSKRSKAEVVIVKMEHLYEI